jgi:hypothetical protein
MDRIRINRTALTFKFKEDKFMGRPSKLFSQVLEEGRG